MRSNTNIFERLSFLSLALVIILLPIFVLPFTSIPVETAKGLLLVIGLALSAIFWVIARFIDGQIVLPKSWLLLSGLSVVVVLLLSSLASVNPQVSLFGIMFDVGSFWFIFAGFVLMLLSSIIFRTPKQAKLVLMGAVLASFVLLVFQSAHLFMPNILSLGILAGKTGNILGSWNALGLFAGFASLMFLLIIEFFPISKIGKMLLQIFIVLSLLLVAVVNFSLVWILLGISSLIIFVYKVSITLEQRGEEDKKHFPMVSFIVMMVSLLFFLNPLIPGTAEPQYLGNFISSKLNITNTEVSPSLSSTLSITKGVLAKHPFWGIGPNRFGEAWAMYKPAVINGSLFWDTSFDTGSGLLPTGMATTGGLGLLAWLVFIVLFLWIGVKSVFLSIKNSTNWEMMAFFVLSLYLLISAFFYSTGAVIFLLLLAFIGVFLGLNASSSGGEITISFLNDHRKSFFSILALILMVAASVAMAFKYIERFASVPYFYRAVSATTVPAAADSIAKAISLYSNDYYLRTYSQIYLLKLNSLVSKGDSLTDADKAELKLSFDQVVNSAQMAANYDPSNYLNFQALGEVYQRVGSIGVKDAYSNAVLAYQTASSLNPLNPGLKFFMADASLSDGKTKEAKEYASAALTLKPDYIDALLVLARIAKSEGENSKALSYAQTALSFAPTNKNLIDYVNSLKNNSAPTTPAPTTTTPPAKTKK